jgi:hypothetical protein
VLQLQELLPNRLAREAELVGELRNGRRSALFQRRENRAPAVRQLLDCENRDPRSCPASSAARKIFRNLYFALFRKKRSGSLRVEFQ